MARKAKLQQYAKPPKFEVRKRNRCLLCGRPRGYYRRFRICRICLRTHALRGDLPGVTKSSW